MIIYNANGTTLLDVMVDDSSYSYAEVMNRDDVTLEFSLASYVNIPTGSYITVDGKDYQLLKNAEVTVVNRRNFHYTAVFETDMGKLALWRIKNTADGHVKFPLTAKPSQHMALFVDNLNAHEGSNIWKVNPTGYDEGDVELSYNCTTVRDGIQQLAEKCETEWEVYRSGGYIYLSLGKVEYNASSPLALSYGENGGFESGVKRTNEGGGMPIEVLYVQGGDRNIDSSNYPGSTLLLPRGQNNQGYSFNFDGELFKGESGYDSSKAVAMVTDANGFSVKLSSATRASAEETLDISDIYPKRVGTITAVETESSSGDYPFYNIVDGSLGTGSGKENIDFNDYMIEGEQFTVIFQSGYLVGREIGVHAFSIAADKGTFKLAQETIDGYIMPGESPFVPAVGDTYAVFGCRLPDGYLRNYSTHTGAEFEMLRKAAKYIYENCKSKQSFKGTLAKVYARKNWSTIGPKLILGGYVNFTDTDVQSDAVSMRIMSVKRYVNNPYKPEVELSNEATKGTVGSSIQSLVNNKARTERDFYDARGYTNRRWRDAKEGQDMLQEAIDALGDEFSEGINPVTIQTMSAVVGSQNLQYEIYTSNTYSQIVSVPAVFDASGNLVCSAGYVRHYTLGFDESEFVKMNRTANDYYHWQLLSATFAFTDSLPYYLYIKASKPASKATLGSASYMLSRTPIPFEPTGTVPSGANYDTSHYYFLLATVSSELEDGRSIATYNGFTEITPGMIRAMKWMSNDGKQFIDFVNKSFRIGDASKFIGYNLDASGDYDGNGVLRLKGTLVQSPSGDAFPPPCNRGDYVDDTPYFYGDQVTYQGESWLYINPTSTTGTTPEEGTYWHKTAAKGEAGLKSTIVYLYKRSDNTATIDWTSDVSYSFETKTLSNVPSGWSATIPTTVNNVHPLWVTAATASTASGNVATIAYTSWATPVLYVDNGMNTATVVLYKRAAANSAPSAPGSTLTYTFASGTMTPADSGTGAGGVPPTYSGWSLEMPANDADGNPCWKIQATAISSGAQDEIGASEWSAAVKILENGSQGSQGAMPRGLNEWKPNTVYLSGAAGEEYRDYVIVSTTNKKYRCTVSHTSGSSFDATEALNWSEANDMDFVAMRALVADDIIALNAKIERLATKKLESELSDSGKTTIAGGNISVTDASGNPRVNIHGTAMTDTGAGTSITRSLSTESGTCGEVDANITLTLLDLSSSSERITVSNSNNKVSIPAFSLSVSKSSSVANPQVGDVSVSIAFVSSTTTKTVFSESYTVSSSSQTISIPAQTTVLGVDTWGLYAYIGFIGEDGKTGTYSASLAPSSSTLTVAIQETTAINEMASDGFRSVWSGKGIQVTSSGAKVKHDSSGFFDILTGSNGIKRICIVTGDTYPTPVDGVLYVKVGTNNTPSS